MRVPSILLLVAITLVGMSTAAGNYALSRSGAQSYCSNIGWGYSTSYGCSAVVCYTSSRNDYCAGCSRWRLVVYADGGDDCGTGMTDGDTYATKAGHMYGGHPSCTRGWNLPSCGTWTSYADGGKPDVPSLNVVAFLVLGPLGFVFMSLLLVLAVLKRSGFIDRVVQEHTEKLERDKEQRLLDALKAKHFDVKPAGELTVTHDLVWTLTHPQFKAAVVLDKKVSDELPPPDSVLELFVSPNRIFFVIKMSADPFCFVFNLVKQERVALPPVKVDAANKLFRNEPSIVLTALTLLYWAKENLQPVDTTPLHAFQEHAQAYSDVQERVRVQAKEDEEKQGQGRKRSMSVVSAVVVNRYIEAFTKMQASPLADERRNIYSAYQSGFDELTAKPQPSVSQDVRDALVFLEKVATFVCPPAQAVEVMNTPVDALIDKAIAAFESWNAEISQNCDSISLFMAPAPKFLAPYGEKLQAMLDKRFNPYAMLNLPYQEISLGLSGLRRRIEMNDRNATAWKECIAMHRSLLSELATATSLTPDTIKLYREHRELTEQMTELMEEIDMLRVQKDYRKRDKKEAIEAELVQKRKEYAELRVKEADLSSKLVLISIACPEFQPAVQKGEEVDSLASYEYKQLSTEARNTLYFAKSPTSAVFDLVIKEYTLIEAKKRTRFAKEVEVMKRVIHPRVMPVTRVFYSPDGAKGYVVMPKMVNDLLDHINTTTDFGGVWLQIVFREVLRAIECVHGFGVIHCDIKPENILLDDDTMPVLTDFDVSMNAEDAMSATVSVTMAGGPGSMQYIAPEVAKSSANVSTKADIFSLGRTFQTLADIAKKKHGFTPSEHFLKLLAEMTNEDADKRPEAHEALLNPFFKTLLVNEKKLLSEKEDVERVRSEASKLAADYQQRVAKAQADGSQLESEKKRIQQQANELRERERKARAVEAVFRLPWYWNLKDPMAPAPVRKINVTGEMRAMVQQALSNTCRSATLGQGRDQVVKMKYSYLEVVSVFRIENLAAWKDYCNCRHSMSQRVQCSRVDQKCRLPWMEKSDLHKDVNEEFLWHGTKPEIVDLIVHGGFEERVCSLGGLFGAGVYFAEECSKSDQYCTPEPKHDHVNGTYNIFLSRVCLGEPFRTSQEQPEMRIPPYKYTNDPSRGRYDSVLGHTHPNKYREFIVYDRHQAYPEFLIKYRRK